MEKPKESTTFSELESSRDELGGKEEEEGKEVKPVVHFNLFYALGLTFSITAVPLSIGSYLSLVLGLGGSPIYLYCFIFVAVFQFIKCCAIAELTSGIPHTSGPAYWVKVLSPPQFRVFFEYLVGWWTTLAWMCVCAASNLYVAKYIVALAEFLHPSYHHQGWHTWLISCAVSLVSLALNLPGGFKLMPYCTGTAVVSVNATAIFFIVALLARTQPKQSASVVFVEAVNESGWDSLGVVFFLSMLPGVACLGAFDSALHLTDELPKPTKQVPQVMLGSFGLGVITGIATIIILGFCNVNPAALLTPVGGIPLVQLFIEAYDSTALVVAATVLIIIALTICTTNCLTSWSRLYWSFSRTGMIPFHSWTSKLSSRDSLPVNALLWNTVLANAITAIEIGNTTAMSAILGGVGLCSIFSFALSLGLLLYQGREQSLDPNRWFNLGRWGLLVNCVSLAWCAFLSVWLCFPSYLPATPESANYTAAVVVGFTAVAGMYWVGVFAKKKVM